MKVLVTGAASFADTDELRTYTGFAPAKPVEEGVRRFVV